ncbi:MAG: arginase family protein, partial [Chloroflexota bacterium]|nr:arginase family protein [Chloroflexota bacterium]
MKVCLIAVPYMAGDERAGSSRGPDRYLAAGAEQLLAPKGLTLRTERVERGEAFRDTVSASLAVCRDLARVVSQAVGSGELPFVLAGGCDASKGILSGLDHAATGIIWLDPHGDFNTPESTISGYFPGMSLALITGHCYRSAWAQLGNAEPIPESATLLIGVRDLDPAEQERLSRSAVGVVPWRDGQPQADLQAALDRLAARVREVYLHIDIDALDPALAPGVVDRPVPGGLSLEQIEDAIRAVTDRFALRAIDLAVYNPDRDEKDRT